ncbi:trehalose-phosphatase [Acuticoccus sp. MNP-M23]|uniref:trehalose-phosphatase n=1 Tax=Acuticoccus sp. MNP-M23 TaxID=3072793 RepID=UPI002814A3DD|nr:trehalose-phosphatase [Acuticoccus sp. MNP-M23]WMS42816.1 trehalose-phosphatase [Acuticoccus sp. MNP-M23]
MTPPVPERFALFLDFDGTLVDITDRPDGVLVADGLQSIIEKVVDRADGAVAVVTGRKVADVDTFLAMPIAAAGMHGLERRPKPGAGIDHAPPPEEIATLRDRIQAWDGLGDGVSMEDKGAGLAIHYRAAPGREDEVKAQMKDWAEDLQTLHLIHGKMVVEAKGKGFDKGVAVDAFMENPPFAGRTPIFIGDDTTDEDGMRAAQAAGGFGIKVGEGETCAKYRLPDVPSVHDWLRNIAEGLS